MISSRLSQIQDQVAYPSDLVSRSDSPDGTVVTLTINNAVRANCLSTPVLTALLAVIKSINSQISLDHSIDKEDPVEFAERVRRSHAPNPVPKVVIIKSAGNIFCSGHDLREIHSADGDYITIHNVFDLCNTVMLSIQRLPQIVISQVQGVATGAGAQLAAQADLCVAAPTATFCTPGVQRGAFCTTPSVAISRSIQLPKQALRMLLTGEQYSAQQAYDCGLISHIAEGDLDQYTGIIAEDIAKAASTTLILGKRGFYEQKQMRISNAYEFAAKVMARNFCLKDSKEGVTAFIEKRPPKWR